MCLKIKLNHSNETSFDKDIVTSRELAPIFVCLSANTISLTIADPWGDSSGRDVDFPTRAQEIYQLFKKLIDQLIN